MPQGFSLTPSVDIMSIITTGMSCHNDELHIIQIGYIAFYLENILPRSLPTGILHF